MELDHSERTWTYYARLGYAAGDRLVSLGPSASLGLVGSTDSAGVFTRYVYAGATAPDYFVRGGITYRILKDPRGSVWLVVDAATGAVAQRIDYGPFGEVVDDTNAGFQPFGYAGGLYDPTTGLVRFGVRDYDAYAGRWTAKDPGSFHRLARWSLHPGSRCCGQPRGRANRRSASTGDASRSSSTTAAWVRARRHELRR